MDGDRRAQWLRGALDLCVLALLTHGESYGYELSQTLESTGLGPIQGGTLYPVLLRLERSGQITGRWRGGEAGPARKYYRISRAGSQTLRRATVDWTTFADGVSAILREVPAR